MDDDREGEGDATFEAAADRRVRVVALVAWAIGLGAVLVRGLDLFWYVFLTAYAIGILYALHLRQVDDPEGPTAIWWALIVPPLAWWTFLLHWLEHRGRHPAVEAEDPDADPTTAD